MPLICAIVAVAVLAFAAAPASAGPDLPAVDAQLANGLLEDDGGLMGFYWRQSARAGIVGIPPDGAYSGSIALEWFGERYENELFKYEFNASVRPACGGSTPDSVSLVSEHPDLPSARASANTNTPDVYYMDPVYNGSTDGVLKGIAPSASCGGNIPYTVTWSLSTDADEHMTAGTTCGTYCVYSYREGRGLGYLIFTWGAGDASIPATRFMAPTIRFEREVG